MVDDMGGGSGPVKILGPNCSAGWSHSVAIVVWRNETRSEDVRAVSAMLAAAGRPKGIGLLQIVEASCTALDADARNALSEMLGHGRSYIRFSAVVFCGGGFKAAAVRAIATGLSMVVRRGFPHEVFASIDEACGRLVEYAESSLRRERALWDLQTAVERVRKASIETAARRSTRDQSAPSF